jgi:FKBP-type peptidyl-prolyl cis-trans isomerase 2
MTLQKKDFIEIEFTGSLKDGGVFDSNVKSELEKSGIQGNPKPFTFCLGEGMFLSGVEEFLIGKNLGEYEIELSPEKAFGKRDQSLIQKIPKNVFTQQKLNPIPGYVFNFDGKLGRVIASSGGRVIVDFNNPLAGKDVIYKIKILRKLDDMNEKIKSFIEFLFRKDLKFSVENKKLIIEVDKPLINFANLFKDKFKDILEMEVEIQETKS